MSKNTNVKSLPITEHVHFIYIFINWRNNQQSLRAPLKIKGMPLSSGHSHAMIDQGSAITSI